MSFVFFDTETTGLSKAFDQIVQFAAIRTDADLMEIDRFEVRSRLQPQVVPHPKALLTNGLTIDQLREASLPSHYEMVRQIVAKLRNWSPAIFLGYNSIRFDEELLRQALYQTLHSPWLTSNHGNCRADVMGLALAASALAPGCLSIPTNADGRKVFKLDQLAPLNGAVHDRAHDALADVNATLHLCRCVRDNAPEVWNRFVRFSKKATVAEFVRDEEGFVLTEFYGQQAYHTVAARFGGDPQQPNVSLCLNLAIDLDQLSGFSDEELQEFVRQKPSPVRRVKVNGAPTLMALYESSDELLGGLSVDEAETRARRLKQNVLLCERLVDAYAAGQGPWPTSAHVEKRLYEDLAPPDDEVRMDSFHRAKWEDRPKIVAAFEDDRFRELGRRLIVFERPDVVAQSQRLEVNRMITDRLLSLDQTDGQPMTPSWAHQEVAKVLAEAGATNVDHIVAYGDYLAGRIERLTAFRQRHFG